MFDLRTVGSHNLENRSSSLDCTCQDRLRFRQCFVVGPVQSQTIVPCWSGWLVQANTSLIMFVGF